MEQISSIATNKQPGTYKITFRKIARAAAAELRVHKKLAIIAAVLYGVAMLLFVFNAHFENYNYGFPPTEFEPSYWGVGFAVLGVLMTLFDVLSVFRDTGNQQLCDVGMALPIKASERFLSKLLCLVYIQIAPFIVSVLGGNGIAVLFGSLRHGKLYDETSKFIFTLFFMGLASILFIMAITTLCACCCGALAESAYFSFIMMFIINGLPVAFLVNILNRSAGFQGSWYWLLSPEGLNVDLGYWGFLFFLNLDYDPIILHAAVGCVISIAVTLLSGLIYKKRDARSVGTPISSKLFFEIMMAGACAAVFSITFMSSDVLWGVLIAAVAYIIINIIVSRAKINAISFAKWIGKFAVTAAVFTALTVACIKTGGFGYYSIRPDAVYLKGADYKIFIDINNGYTTPQIFNKQELTAEQADEVMKICKKHIQKGIAEVNPIDVIFDKHSQPLVEVYSSSEVGFEDRPSPGFMFPYRRFSHWDTKEEKSGYYLSYDQYVYISPNEAQALAEELKQLDYMQEYKFTYL